jgi:hypothetical protein
VHLEDFLAVAGTAVMLAMVALEVLVVLGVKVVAVAVAAQ